jgi:hypothetical protein
MIVAIVVDTKLTVPQFPTGAIYRLPKKKEDCGLVCCDLNDYSFVLVSSFCFFFREFGSISLMDVVVNFCILKINSSWILVH